MTSISNALRGPIAASAGAREAKAPLKAETTEPVAGAAPHDAGLHLEMGKLFRTDGLDDTTAVRSPSPGRTSPSAHGASSGLQAALVRTQCQAKAKAQNPFFTRGEAISERLEAAHKEAKTALRKRFGLDDVPTKKQVVVAAGGAIEHAKRLATYLDIPTDQTYRIKTAMKNKNEVSQSEARKARKSWATYCDDNSASLDDGAIVFVGEIRRSDMTDDEGNYKMRFANLPPVQFVNDFLDPASITPKHVTIFSCSSEGFAQDVSQALQSDSPDHTPPTITAFDADHLIESYPSNRHLNQPLQFFYAIPNTCAERDEAGLKNRRSAIDAMQPVTSYFKSVSPKK